MTELVLNAAPATALAVSFATLPTGSALIAYRGVLTPKYPAPQHLDAANAETDALLRGAAVHDLGWLRRIAVRGEDRFRWLSGMVTNAVETLPEHGGAYNLVLNAQGRIQGDAYIWRDGDDLEIEITADQSEALLAHLDHFIIMDDVELIALPERAALGITGPESGRILSALGLPCLSEELSIHTGSVGDIPVKLERAHGPALPHYALWTDAAHIHALWQAILGAGATPVGAAALETLRIVEGVPAYGVDIQSRDLAQETAQMRALSFTKGCYLGQEIVERIRSRGQVHRHLRAVELVPDGAGELPSAGAEVTAAGGKPAGTLTSVTSLQLDGARRIFSIAMIRAEAEAGRQPLSYPGGRVQILNAVPKLTTA
jgi:folate-binding protein YgfZ